MKTNLIILVISAMCLNSYANGPHKQMHDRMQPNSALCTLHSAPKANDRHFAHGQLSYRERMDMAVSFLHRNRTMSVRDYLGITGLSWSAAEAELNAFVRDRAIPIALVVSGNRKEYVLTNPQPHEYERRGFK